MAVINHIHLDLPTVGHDADDGPLHRWGVVNRQPQITIQAQVHRSASGHTYVSRVLDSGDVMQHNDWVFQLRMTLSELEYLRTMNGMVCEFIDNVHVADGTDHLSSIQSVTLLEIQSVENLGPMMTNLNVTIQLIDMTNP